MRSHNLFATSTPDLATLLSFAVIFAWMVAGFRNAVIGFIFMQLSPPMPWLQLYSRPD
jgi:hypothetical protein